MSCNEILGRFHSTKEMGILWLFGDVCFLRHVQRNTLPACWRGGFFYTRNPIFSYNLLRNWRVGKRSQLDGYFDMKCASFCKLKMLLT